MEFGNSRKPAVADMFYPGKPEILKKMIFGFLEKAAPGGGQADVPELPGRLKAVIVPHAGYIYSGPIAAYSYKLFRKLDPKIDWKVLLLGPSHFKYFSGASISCFDEWKMPLGNVKVKDVRKEIKDSSENIIEVDDCDDEEHSLEVQVPFLQTVLKKFTLYPLILGEVKSVGLADDLCEFCKRDDVITVVSSDLSHYLEYEEAKKVDSVTGEAVCDLDLEKMAELGDACGKTGILILLNIARKLGWKCKMLDYRNSGDTAGDKDRVVGYGAFAFYD